MLFFKGKKVTKGVCTVAKLATLCISISTTMGETENMHCVYGALIKLVPLKGICVNALTLTAYILTLTHTHLHLVNVKFSRHFYIM